MIAFGGVIEDHVEDHLDAGRMQPRHHGLERFDAAVGAVALIGREETDRVVAPIVPQTLFDQMPVVDEGMHRQELDAGDAEPPKMLDQAGRRQAAEQPAPAGRNVLAQHGDALDVRLVDDRVVPGDLRGDGRRPR